MRVQACSTRWARVCCAHQTGLSSQCSFVNVIFFDTCSDDSFGDDDALVACRQLGFTRGSALYQNTLNATFPVKGGDGPVWLDDLACNATVHTAVEQCPSNGWGVNDCSHIEDVGVYCRQSSKPVSCMLCLAVVGRSQRGRLPQHA
jgi:hypothetical protein